MVVALDQILADAQDSQSRKPICKISSLENQPSIPFDGHLLSTSTVNEQHPDAKMHSTGRLFAAYFLSTNKIRFAYTDLARTFYSYVDFTLQWTNTNCDLSACELADGNVGLVWTETYSTTRYLKYRVITVTGENLSPAVTGQILSNSTTITFSGPSALRMADDTYLMVYAMSDSGHYHIYKRTSLDFQTWSEASEVPLSGLDDTHRKSNPYLLLLIDTKLWLLFDYVQVVGPNGEEQSNVYSVTSDDKLVNTTAPVVLTNYGGYSEKAEHPEAVQTGAAEVCLVFTKLMSALHMDQSTTGWGSTISGVGDMHIDQAEQKLYCTALTMGVGGKMMTCIVKIDLATWTIDKSWSTTSNPAFNTYCSGGGGSWYDCDHGEGFYVPLCCGGNMVALLNADSDTITNYVFNSVPAYGLTQNVTWTPKCGTAEVYRSWIDANSERMYVMLGCGYVYHTSFQIGYIDLTAPGPEYNFTEVVNGYKAIGNFSLAGLTNGNGWWQVLPQDDLIIVSCQNWEHIYNVQGILLIYQISTGGLWRSYTRETLPGFPWRGLRRGIYHAGKIYGDFEYEPLYDEGYHRGLCIVDPANNTVAYSRPSWASLDDYQLFDMCVNQAGEFIIGCGGRGITLFDGVEWTLYDQNSLPGLTPNGANYFYFDVVYNELTRMIITSSGINWGQSWEGVVMISRDGFIKQTNYRIGTFTDEWEWGDISPLLLGYQDYDATPAIDIAEGALYAFWTNKNGNELSIKWDKDLPAFDLVSYLVRGSEVNRQSSLDADSGNWDASLEFELSHGHLFDTSNAASLLRKYCSQGRKIYQQFGELIDGVETWEPAQTFTISEDGEVSYERPEYPLLKVKCETPRKKWEEIHIVGSPYYNTTPELIIAALLENYADIPPGKISMGTWDNSVIVEYQFVDIHLSEAVDMLAVHFGYAIRDGADEMVEAVKISNSKAIDRTYSNNSKIVKATPLAKFSSFVNQWTVTGEEKTFLELIMAEEMCAEFNAMHCWNTGPKDYRIDYTQGKKLYRYPRMEVIDSVGSIVFALAGGCSETMVDNSHDDPDFTKWDTYCTVHIDSPDLTPELIAAIAGLVGTYFLPDSFYGCGSGSTIRIGTMLTAAMMFAIAMILAAIGNFTIKIYGQPVVKSRRKIQATVDDIPFQAKVGRVIADQPFEDPLCSSPAECLAVANYRKMVAMSERTRWSAEMIADLRNEVGDTISVVHPVSGDGVVVFITDIERSFVMPKETTGEGKFSQNFEGWRR